jgi:hypothetical protein
VLSFYPCTNITLKVKNNKYIIDFQLAGLLMDYGEIYVPAKGSGDTRPVRHHKSTALNHLPDSKTGVGRVQRW